MKVEVHVIQARLPRWLKPIMVYVGVPLSTVMGLSVAVYAANVVVPNVFVDGNALTAAAVNANFTALRTAIDDLAAVAASPYSDCPLGYTRYSTVGAVPVLCKKGKDEVVKVGTGSSAFWIDRYEASIWSSSLGSGGSFPTQYGIDAISSLAYPATFPITGENTLYLFAVSETGVEPASYATWHQADLACRYGGKRLPTGEEWLLAVGGTVDPGKNDGTTNTACATALAATNLDTRRNTGIGVTGCVSVWGAQDMIGNLSEYTADWGCGAGKGEANQISLWESYFNGDATWNVTAGAAAAGQLGYNVGIPGVVVRGGPYSTGVRSGAFSMNLSAGPTSSSGSIGFRCAISR